MHFLPVPTKCCLRTESRLAAADVAEEDNFSVGAKDAAVYLALVTPQSVAVVEGFSAVAVLTGETGAARHLARIVPLGSLQVPGLIIVRDFLMTKQTTHHSDHQIIRINTIILEMTT